MGQPADHLAHPHTEAAPHGRLLVGLAVLLLLSAVPRASLAAPAKPTKDPVILVHGCILAVPRVAWAQPHLREAFLNVYWGPMRNGFGAAGYPQAMVHVMEFEDPCGDNRVNAKELARVAKEVLERTGAKRLDLVAHSMACLSTRLYTANKGREKVDDSVEIAGACHGTDFPEAQFRAGTLNGENEGYLEMDPPYACSGVQRELNGCFNPISGARLRAFDETPGRTSFLAIYTDTDELIVPPEAACLNQRYMGDCGDRVNHLVRGRHHMTIHQDADVVAMVARASMND